MTSFYTGDIPAEALIVEPTIAGVAPDDLSAFSAATVGLYGPDGLVIADTGITATIEDQDIEIHFPSTSVFTVAGLYRLALALTATGVRVTADSAFIVSQIADEWHTLGSARQAFGNDFPDDDVLAWRLLQVARVGLTEYGTSLTGIDATIAFQQAQLMQARNVLNSAKTDPSTGADGTVFVIRPFPLDNFIKAILRPRKAVPTWR